MQKTGARGNLLGRGAIYWGPGQFTGAQGSLMGSKAIYCSSWPDV